VNLWRLELARLLRTHRWMILVGVFGLFAVSGPLLVAYLEEFLALFGDEIVIQLPEQRPVDGIAEYVGGVSQLGLLAVVIVAAAALAMDARPEVAAFLRTRVTQARVLLLPRYAVVAGAAAVTLVGGMAVAWLLTGVLMGALPAGPMLLGTLCGVLYLGFAVAVVAAVAGFTRGLVGTIIASVAALLALPLLALVGPVRPWLPSELVTAVVPLVEGAPATGIARAVAVTLVATPALLVLAARRLARREL
jgi:ABC-2 type transport system permease protein